MRIKIYSYSNYSTAQDWAGYFRTAFMENTVASKNPWDSAYQINITNVSNSKTQAISKILSNTAYNEITYGNGVYNIKSYSYGSYSSAQEWAGYFNEAFNINSNHARVSQNPWDSGYQINIPNLNSSRSQAISKALSTKAYHEISNDETTPPPSGGYQWPTVSKGISQRFFIGTSEANSHYGIDITPTIAGKAGDPIYAFADGKVSRVFKWDSGTSGNASMGNCIFIDGNNPIASTGGSLIRTMYMHLNGHPTLNVGTSVSKGQKIGYMGNTGRSSGVHLHFGTKVANSFPTNSYNEGVWVNPNKYFSWA